MIKAMIGMTGILHAIGETIGMFITVEMSILVVEDLETADILEVFHHITARHLVTVLEIGLLNVLENALKQGLL